ncbi:MAG: heme exporter protein CcmD [Burkholderiales bacterium]|jgi:heme exporter protein D|nr:heme exporter protein CcmD [Burkholderiales bacterium]
MQWQSLDSFLSMGGYGFYVWGSYVVCAVLIMAEIWALRHRRRTAVGELKRARPAAGRSA